MSGATENRLRQEIGTLEVCAQVGPVPVGLEQNDDDEPAILRRVRADEGVRERVAVERGDVQALEHLGCEIFESERERCSALASLTTWASERFAGAEYRAAGGGRCAGLAPEELLAADGD